MTEKSNPPNRSWLPLLVIGMLTIALCSGIATALAGQMLGRHVAATGVILFVGFSISLLASWFFLRGKLPKDEEED